MKLKGFLLIAALSALLLLGQSVAVTALNDNGSIEADIIHSEKDFAIDIFFVGSGVPIPTAINEFDGTYDFVSETSLTSLVVKANLQGYTTVTDETNETLAETVGQLFLIIDGVLSTVGPGYMYLETGALITLSQGTHVVSFLYVGNGNEGFQFASDSIIIRIAKSADDFDDLIIDEIDLDYQVTDKAVAGGDWANPTPVYYEPIWDDWARDLDYTPENNVGIYATSEDNVTKFVDGISFDFGDANYKVLINGSVDTTGTDGYSFQLNATDGDFIYDDDGAPVSATDLKTTTGYLFLVDANGVTFIDDNTPTTIDVIKLPDANATGQAYTYIGVLALADYGYWTDPWWGAHDLDGFTASGDGEIEYDYSFDFVATLSGVYVADAIAAEAPGFQATETAFALVTLGVVAFLIPRFRKEEK